MHSKNIEIKILQYLSLKYANSDEIYNYFKSENINIRKNSLYPTLSGLNLKNYLCCNWINKNNSSKKYYYLTTKGEKFLKTLNINNFKTNLS